jgi:hypothetical protein
MEVKQPERKADHSPSSIAEVKKAWNYSSTTPYTFMVWCLIKYKDIVIILSLHLPVVVEMNTQTHMFKQHRIQMFGYCDNIIIV